MLHGRVVWSLCILCLASGCTDSLLDVDNPDVIKPPDVKGDVGVNALFEGARAEFIAAHDGDGSYFGTPTLPSSPGLVYASGLFADEFLFPATPPDLISMDRRDILITNSTMAPVYLVLHRARVAAEAAIVALKALPNGASDPRLGESYALAGYTYTLFGELYCSGVPFSQSVDGVITPGQSITTAQMFDEAMTRFDQGAAATAGDPDLDNLIRVARGRTLLDQGHYAEAAQAVSAVPTAFRFENPHTTSDPRASSILKNLMWDTFFLGVSDTEGTNGLDFVFAGDPRVQTVGPELSNFDQETEVYRAIMFESGSAPVLLASGVEARLIEAEAALKAGDVTTFLDQLNEARTPWNLQPLADPGSTAAREDLLFHERGFALYGSSHRMGDLRRFVRQYGRDPESVFPTGAYHKDNLTRGNQVAFPVPQTEQNNPNYDPSVCDPTTP